jgi:assimilatory nitrate reductase catalytic subunit
MTSAPVRTACPYCGVGCGVIASVDERGDTLIAGDREHPANFGRLCSKGSALGATLALDDRLLFPQVNGERVAWDAALDLVARRFAEAIAAHGPESVAIYGSGQLLTEDYYVANKLMKGFIGSGNMDTNSRLCMASSVAGHKRAFGSDTVPGTYEDLEQADLVVLVGSNLAWCHPVLFQRLEAAKKTRDIAVVVIDPRRTATCELADSHLAIAPGSDVPLFNGLLVYLADHGHFDQAYVADHTRGVQAAVSSARAMSLDQIADCTGVDGVTLTAFYQQFAASQRVVTIYSQGVNQSSAGTDKVNAIINCHLATGRIGKHGMGPFSVTGQPNAMGGREVGGLANMLAAHMELAHPAHRAIVSDFWQSPVLAKAAGYKATDLFRAVGDGRIKALWIMATNPADSLPEADSIVAALRACPFVVVSDAIARTDTTAYAHVLLPAAAWGEKNGTVTNSERRISRQRAFLPAPGETKPDWWMVAEVAKRMGFAKAFTYAGPSEIFAEHAALSGASNGGSRDFDISAHAAITPEAYETLTPFQWPQRAGAVASDTRFFAEGQFYTADKRGVFVATPYRAPSSPVSAAFPLVLNTGRIRDQWHTMTRTGKAPRLMSHLAEPFAELHPDDAQLAGIVNDHLVRVSSPHGSVVVRAAITDRQRAGSVFVPMHWTDQLASAARINASVESAVDPISGQPELKHTPVAISPFNAGWHGLLVTAHKPKLACEYWALAPVQDGWRAELAWCDTPVLFPADGGFCSPTKADWTSVAQTLLGERPLVTYQDAGNGHFRFAAFEGTQLIGVLFISRAPITAARSWAAGQLSQSFANSTARGRVLAGRAGGATADHGPTVCACFDVGFNQIISAITTGGCVTVEAVGAVLKAGTNCGSCRSEIRRIIADKQLVSAD